MGGLPRFSAQPACGAAGNKLQQLVSDSATHNHECTRIVQMRHDGMKKIDVQRVRVPEAPSTRHGGRARASRDRSSSTTSWQAALGRDAPPARRNVHGNPRLSGGQGEGKAPTPLVRAAVDLGLQFGSDGIQGLLEVRVVAAAMGLLQPLPG